MATSRQDQNSSEVIRGINSIDFVSMSLTTRWGRKSMSYGAVVFSSPNVVSRIVLPHPTIEDLYKELQGSHFYKFKASLVLKGIDRTEFVRRIEAFCNEGIPLPDIFDASIANLTGISQFQRKAYEVLSSVPHGETRSYSWLASKLRKPGAERAVGRAMRTNPFPLVIPCHRIVNKDGALGGFSGTNNSESWQLTLKRALLDLEEQHRQPSLFAADTRRRHATQLPLNLIENHASV